MSHIKKLLIKSEGGAEFCGKIKEEIGAKMDLLFDERNHFKKLMIFLEILNKLARFERIHFIE